MRIYVHGRKTTDGIPGRGGRLIVLYGYSVQWGYGKVYYCGGYCRLGGIL